MTAPTAYRRQPERRFCVAPMMDCTDRHDRYLLRLISRRTLLYTEMLTTGAILHGDRDRLMGFSGEEHPVALQLGGSEPAAMARAAEAGAAMDYDEININVGCPSERVQSGRFGACLMAEPETVAACVQAMRAAVDLPVTVKSRIGIDDADGYDDLVRFIEPVAAAGCATFIVHARKAVLGGLSPKQNREIPPLRPELVWRLKQDYPALEIIINGGVRSLAEAEAHLAHVDGVMVGREAYSNPWLLAGVDARLYGDAEAGLTRHDVVEAMYPYIAERLAEGVRLSAITRHMVGLFAGQPGARAWRRSLSENACRPGAGLGVVRAALAQVPRAEEPREDLRASA